MRLHFFTVPALMPEAAQDAINAFCAQHRIVSAEKHFVACGAESYWGVCLTWIEGALPQPGQGGKRERTDYRDVLSEADFAVFAELRTLRKAVAEREGVPAYALFTNEQLAEMVTRKAATLGALGEVEGVGKARLEKYGALFLAVLGKAYSPGPEIGEAGGQAPVHQPE